VSSRNANRTAQTRYADGGAGVQNPRARQRALAIGVASGPPADEPLAELKELLRTAGVATAGELVQQRSAPDPDRYLGRGKLTELKRAIKEADANLVACDDELAPRQERNLEAELGVPVIDRTAVILDIFADHAHTAEGKLQVELAQLEYNLQRMRGMWKHLERLGGGIGTRGPGETQLESDRRMARRRISLVKARLRDVAARRQVMRTERSRNETPTVALAGYTNVGKSTLLNALTGAHVSVDNRLFETLDPTTRSFNEGGRSYLVTDTVGFIRKLPHGLVEAFAATLEETLAGDLLLIVADASAGEEAMASQLASVRAVLEEIDALDIPQLLVLNKIDRVDEVARRRLANRNPQAVQVSALTGEGLDTLKQRVAEFFADRYVDVQLLLPHDHGRELSALYETGAPITSREDSAAGVLVSARLPQRLLTRFAAYRADGR
jgi:GTP-binding protein HflX